MIDFFTDAFFMQKALDEAQLALSKNEVPVGAVIVVDNKIIARGHNLTEILHDVTAHAEMQTITAAANYLGSKYLKNCTLYVTLEPCPMCAGALYWSQISKIVFGATDKNNNSELTKTLLHPKTLLKSGVLATECSLILQEFFTAKRKKKDV